jgi:hypothetical protein
LPCKYRPVLLAHPQRVRQTQHVTYFPHRHSLRRHRSPLGRKGDRSADSTVDGSALYGAITCCPQSPDCCPPCAGNGVRVAPDSPADAVISIRLVQKIRQVSFFERAGRSLSRRRSAS